MSKAEKGILSGPPPVFDFTETVHALSNVDAIPSFDGRSDAAVEHPSRMERERALWEFGYRKFEEAAPLIRRVLASEADPSVRWNALWLSLKIAPGNSLSILEAGMSDDHREVRDWAKIHINRLTGSALPREYRYMTYTEEGPFDQTLPLQIAGFALLAVPGMGPLRITLSPLWFEHVMGRVLACTRHDTFMRDLVVEKLLENFHSNGSDHYEIFPFSGISWPSPDGRIQHRYESLSIRKFYPSGKVEDKSKGVLEVPVILNRKASTSLEALESLPGDFLKGGAGAPSSPVARTGPATDARGIRLLNGKVVTTVGGQFFGWAHTSIENYVHHGRVLPGTVQLANPMDEQVAAFVNTYLCGTFCGKIGDYNGDGYLDLNLIPCHGTADGKLDCAADGTLQPDPFA